jgi:hypothetical protein
MINMNNSIKKINFYNYLPFITLFFLILFIHFIVPNIGDDVYFTTALNDTNLIAFIINRYYIWSSRVIIDSFFAIFNGIFPRIIWQLVDTTMYTLIAILLSKLFNKKANIKFNWILVGLILLYPFGDLESAGFVTTTIAYIWPMTCMLYSFYIIDKIINNRTLMWYNYFLAVITTIICCNMEQSCAVFFGFAILSILYLIKNKIFNIKKHYFICILLALCSLELIFILTCPGNSVRALSEINTWFPAYASYNFIDKIYLGIVPTASIILYQKVILFLFSLLLMIYTFINNKGELVRILSVIVFAFFTLFGMFKQFLLNISAQTMGTIINGQEWVEYSCNGNRMIKKVPYDRTNFQEFKTILADLEAIYKGDLNIRESLIKRVGKTLKRKKNS